MPKDKQLEELRKLLEIMTPEERLDMLLLAISLVEFRENFPDGNLFPLSRLQQRPGQEDNEKYSIAA